MSEHGRDDLIDAKRERENLVRSMSRMGEAIEVLMEDRVRHLTALRQIITMTETGIIAQGGAEVHRIATEAVRRRDV